MNIIQTNNNYTYDLMVQDIYKLNKKFPFLNIQTFGKSVMNKNIYVIKLGKGKKQVFYSASIHANEWITSLLLMKFIEDYCIAYTNNSSLYGYSIRRLFNNVSIYIMPMVNPDGVDLVNNAVDKSNSLYLNANKIASEFPFITFPSGWKSNIRGIDLNLQFPAGWELAKEIKYSQGFTKPAPRDFVGFGPLTEPEALAIYNFTLSHNFRLIIAFHTQGKEIYWNFNNINPPNGLRIARAFSESSGYSISNVPIKSSYAGFKDWFIQDYNRPGYTIEAGIGVNPLPLSQFDDMYNDNLGILVLGAIL